MGWSRAGISTVSMMLVSTKSAQGTLEQIVSISANRHETHHRYHILHDLHHTPSPQLTPQAAITQLLALTPTSGPWRKKLADAAIRYSIHVGQAPGGDPELHHYIGELYYKGEFLSPR